MHPETALILPAVPLGFMVISDLSARHISVVWLSAFGAAQAAAAVIVLGFSDAGANALLNMGLLLLLFGALWLYVRAFRRKKFASFGETMGTGDLLFLPLLTPLMGLREFAAFLTVSFVVSLASWGLYTAIFKRQTTIPLVATTGICYACFILISFII